MQLRLLLLFALIIFSSCDKKKEQNFKEDSEINKSTAESNTEVQLNAKAEDEAEAEVEAEVEAQENAEDIALLEEYLAKAGRDLSDEDGFPMRYTVENSWDASKTLATSDTIGWVSGEDGYQYFLNLAVGINNVRLILNGKTQKTVSIIAQIYTLNTLANNKYSSNTEYKKKRYLYYPELENQSARNNIIEELASKPQFNSMRDESIYEQKWNNELTSVVKSSNIFDYESSQDY